ncbi:PsiF family protein [Acidithiobacillus sp. IBUN Pt1247-S3]|uniref:PsiF family protein n=1 Tax=Acidithiobacillus sp. IBUN Pt1247-S3 TaxID=3166642 RepID=UPI0034E50DA3
MLKKVLASCVALSFLLSGAALAETATPATPAPMKMEKKVEHHKVEKKSEKKAEHPRKLTAQQEKMKTCNVRAKGMKGEQRKSFMSECLKKK